MPQQHIDSSTTSLPARRNCLFNSPSRLLVVMIFSILLANFAERFIVSDFSGVSTMTTFAIEAVIDFLLIIPILLVLVFFPLIRHIRERERTEAMLRKNEQNYRQLINTLHEGVWAIDADDKTTFVNQHMAEMLGYTTGEMVGQHLFDFLDEQGVELCKQKLACIRRGIAENHEFELLKKDGIRIRAFVTAAPIVDEHGLYTGAIAAVTDITERRKASEQARKLYQAVEQSPSAIIIVDQQGKIEYVNPGFTRLAGYDLDEVCGKNPSILKSGHTTSQVYQTLWKTITSGHVWHGELLNRKKNGDGLFWAAVAIAPILLLDGTITHYVAIMDDISARKKVEEELLSSRQRLRDLAVHLQRVREEERTRIAREIHDELGQVLATVQVGVSLLAEEYCDHSHLTKKITDFEQMLEWSIKSVRKIATELRPSLLDTLGLGEAVNWQASEFQKNTGISCKIVIKLQREHFEQDVSTALFRIFQEALTNVIVILVQPVLKSPLLKERTDSF